MSALYSFKISSTVQHNFIYTTYYPKHFYNMSPNTPNHFRFPPSPPPVWIPNHPRDLSASSGHWKYPYPYYQSIVPGLMRTILNTAVRGKILEEEERLFGSAHRELLEIAWPLAELKTEEERRIDTENHNRWLEEHTRRFEEMLDFVPEDVTREVATAPIYMTFWDLSRIPSSRHSSEPMYERVRLHEPPWVYRCCIHNHLVIREPALDPRVRAQRIKLRQMLRHGPDWYGLTSEEFERRVSNLRKATRVSGLCRNVL
jgi:hypothetical protein